MAPRKRKAAPSPAAAAAPISALAARKAREQAQAQASSSRLLILRPSLAQYVELARITTNLPLTITIQASMSRSLYRRHLKTFHSRPLVSRLLLLLPPTKLFFSSETPAQSSSAAAPEPNIHCCIEAEKKLYRSQRRSKHSAPCHAKGHQGHAEKDTAERICQERIRLR